MQKRGKPVKHPKIVDLSTGIVYNTYTDAAKDIGGSRYGVMRCCEGLQSHHKGHIFIYMIEKEHK